MCAHNLGSQEALRFGLVVSMWSWACGASHGKPKKKGKLNEFQSRKKLVEFGSLEKTSKDASKPPRNETFGTMPNLKMHYRGCI